VISRRDAAQRLDIPLEMAARHGIPSWIEPDALADLEANPPAWLLQSRANRTGKRPVWVSLTCEICGFTESVRPKKWWPEFTHISCVEHSPTELPAAADGMRRSEIDGIGSRFVGVVDAAVA
jgi:hypothetical protein